MFSYYDALLLKLLTATGLCLSCPLLLLSPFFQLCFIPFDSLFSSSFSFPVAHLLFFMFSHYDHIAATYALFEQLLELGRIASFSSSSLWNTLNTAVLTITICSAYSASLGRDCILCKRANTIFFSMHFKCLL